MQLVDDTDQRGEVDHLDPVELACELREFLAGLELEGSIFRSNHASNYLPLRSTLPRDKEKIIAVLDQVLAERNEAHLKPEWMRGL